MTTAGENSKWHHFLSVYYTKRKQNGKHHSCQNRHFSCRAATEVLHSLLSVLFQPHGTTGIYIQGREGSPAHNILLFLLLPVLLSAGEFCEPVFSYIPFIIEQTK